MIKEILTNTIIGLISGILIIAILSTVGYLVFKHAIIPFIIDKLPDVLRGLFK